MQKNYPIQPTVNCWIFCHKVLWFLLFYLINPKKKIDIIVISIFVLFALFNLIKIEGLFNLNYSTFLIGAITYVIIFLVDIFQKLKNEELSYFSSNNFLLVSSPILFFIGTSLMFGFREREITRVIVFSGLTLYQTIIYFVNFMYYTIINIYLYRDIGFRKK